MKHVLLGLVILTLAAGTAFAHGGSYRGPAGEVPPNMRKPEDPPPPNEGGTPTPPPEEDPGTPTPPDSPNPGGRPDAPPPPGSDDGGGSRPQLPPAAGGGGAGGNTATPGGQRRAGPPPTTFDSWEFWWGYNKDEILNLKAELLNRESGAVTRDNPVGVGSSHERSGEGSIAPTMVKIQQSVIPALESILDDQSAHFDIRAGAVIALAKVGSKDQPRSIQSRIASRLIDIMKLKNPDEHFSVEESAALALGILQAKDEEIVNALCDKALDRRSAFTKNERARAFALLALGLLEIQPSDPGYERVQATFKDVLTSKETNDNTPVCALVGMGLSGDPSYVEALMDMVKEGKAYRQTKLQDLVRSYAASAIGKIVERNPNAFSKDMYTVLHKAMIGSGNHTIRSAVIAFGQIGSQPGVDEALLKQMVRSLEYMVEKGENQAANYALISLGKIGGATADQRLRNRIFETLRTAMKKGSYTAKPFAALALGIMGRSQNASDALVTIRDEVRFEFQEFRGDPKNRGGYAIALGMLRDRAAVPDLIKVLADKGAVKRLRGACAVALGMIGDQQAGDAIKDALANDKDPELRVDTAVAVGLLGDKKSLKMLIEILEDDRSSLYVQGSVTLAVGRIGDISAIDPLVKMMKSDDVQDLNRALAAVALGLLGDRNPIPVLSRIAKDVNYRAQINAMEEVLSIL